VCCASKPNIIAAIGGEIPIGEDVGVGVTGESVGVGVGTTGEGVDVNATVFALVGVEEEYVPIDEAGGVNVTLSG